MTEPEKRSNKYVAILFVHGMGPQAKHENLGALIHALEHYHDEPQFGVLRNFKSRREPHRSGLEDISFVQFDKFDQRVRNGPHVGRWGFRDRVRAYEVYWSPVTSRGASPAKVAIWALSQIVRPLRNGAASWRMQTTLRLARLHMLRLVGCNSPDTPERVERRFTNLVTWLRRYRGAEGGRYQLKSNEGSDFERFSNFVKERATVSDYSSLPQLLEKWRDARLPVEILNRRLLKGAVIIAAAISAFTITVVHRWQPLHPDVPKITIFATMAALGVIIVIASALIGRFLAYTFSDVYIWTSNQEHDREFNRRKEILDTTRRTIEHIVSDEHCKRLVIVSHSLGSTVAYEALSEIGSRNMARAGTDQIIKMNKLSHFFTLGSPIDKVFYFFQTRDSRSYRAGRLNDDLHANLSQEPFVLHGKSRVKWINFWDAADLISDPLYSPIGSEFTEGRFVTSTITNVEVENFRTTDLAKNHVGYIENDNVIEAIAGALFPSASTSSCPRKIRDPFITRANMIGSRYTPIAFLVASLLSFILGYWSLAIAALPIGGAVTCILFYEGARHLVHRLQRLKKRIRW